jgi:hypothetical protein
MTVSDSSRERKLGMDQEAEAAEVAQLIAAEPWQEVTGPLKKKGNGGWFIPTKYVFATWPHDEIPHVHSVYVKREDDQYWAFCIYDIHGKMHER